MKRVKGLLLSAIAFTLLGVQAQPLEIGLNQIVKSLSPNTNISVMVYDLHTQRPIYQYHPHQQSQESQADQLPPHHCQMLPQ